jgi:hypothetical protein
MDVEVVDPSINFETNKNGVKVLTKVAQARLDEERQRYTQHPDFKDTWGNRAYYQQINDYVASLDASLRVIDTTNVHGEEINADNYFDRKHLPKHMLDALERCCSDCPNKILHQNGRQWYDSNIERLKCISCNMLVSLHNNPPVCRLSALDVRSQPRYDPDHVTCEVCWNPADKHGKVTRKVKVSERPGQEGSPDKQQRGRSSDHADQKNKKYGARSTKHDSSRSDKQRSKDEMDEDQDYSTPDSSSTEDESDDEDSSDDDSSNDDSGEAPSEDRSSTDSDAAERDRDASRRGKKRSKHRSSSSSSSSSSKPTYAMPCDRYLESFSLRTQDDLNNICPICAHPIVAHRPQPLCSRRWEDFMIDTEEKKQQICTLCGVKAGLHLSRLSRPDGGKPFGIDTRHTVHLKNFTKFGDEGFKDPKTWIRQLTIQLRVNQVPTDKWNSYLYMLVEQPTLQQFIHDNIIVRDLPWEGTKVGDACSTAVFIANAQRPEHVEKLRQQLKRLTNTSVFDIVEYCNRYQQLARDLGYDSNTRSVIDDCEMRMCSSVREAIANVRAIKQLEHPSVVYQFETLDELVNIAKSLTQNFITGRLGKSDERDSKRPFNKRKRGERDSKDDRPKESSSSSSSQKPQHQRDRRGSKKDKGKKHFKKKGDRQAKMRGVSSADFKKDHPGSGPQKTGKANKQGKASKFVGSLDNKQVKNEETRSCHHCGTVGHLQRDCPDTQKQSDSKPRSKFMHAAPSMTNVRPAIPHGSLLESLQRSVFLKLGDQPTLYQCLLDTGANFSAISSKLVRKHHLHVFHPPATEQQQIQLADGRHVKRIGYVQLRAKLYFPSSKKQAKEIVKKMEVMQTVNDIILGTDILSDIFPSDEIMNYVGGPADITERATSINNMQLYDDDEVVNDDDMSIVHHGSSVSSSSSPMTMSNPSSSTSTSSTSSSSTDSMNLDRTEQQEIDDVLIKSLERLDQSRSYKHLRQMGLSRSAALRRVGRRQFDKNEIHDL